MADILRVSFPGSEKSYINPIKVPPEVSSPFNIVDLARVVKPHSEEALMQQNNSQLEQSEAPAILQEMLKDPKVTVGFLRNIFMLEEIFRLLPSNNAVVTGELKELFDALMLKPDQLLGELLRQSQASSTFQGDVFSILRGLETGGDMRLKQAIANLLKAFSGQQGQEDVLRSISNNLRYLGESQQALKVLSEKYIALANSFKGASSSEFEALKTQVMELLKQQQSSLLNSPTLQKVSAILLYNLSRFQDNKDFLPEAITKLASVLEREGDWALSLLKDLTSKIDNPQLKEKLFDFLFATRPDFSSFLRELLSAHTANEGGAQSASKVMDALVGILFKEGRLSDLQLVADDKLNEIITSLLSSPCNYTPLLHFVIPLDFFDMRAFAEMWVDNNPEYSSGEDRDDEQHVLIAFEIEGIGSFETEIYTQGKDMQVLILCPEKHLEAFSAIQGNLPKIVSRSGYRLKDCRIGELIRGRSLMEVFPDLPHRRMGLGVKA